MRLASPCRRRWDQLEGTDRVRFCRQCRLNVYNLSSLTADEARELLRQREGRLCVRLYRRPDGTVLTRDCPVGVWRGRRRTFAAWAATVLAAVAAPALPYVARALYDLAVPDDALGGLDMVVDEGGQTAPTTHAGRVPLKPFEVK